MTTSKFQYSFILFAIGLVIGLVCSSLKSIKDMNEKFEKERFDLSTRLCNMSDSISKLSTSVSNINRKVSKTMLDAGTIKENTTRPQMQWRPLPPKTIEDQKKILQKNLNEMLDESKTLLGRTHAFKNILTIVSTFKKHKAEKTDQWNNDAQSMFRSLRGALLEFRSARCVVVKDGKPEVDPTKVNSLNFCMMIIEQINDLFNLDVK